MSKSINVHTFAFYGYQQIGKLRSAAPSLRQIQAGWKQADIARAFGLTSAWVSQTLKTFRHQGEAGLTTGKRTGAPPRLTMGQHDESTTQLAKGAEQQGVSG